MKQTSPPYSTDSEIRTAGPAANGSSEPREKLCYVLLSYARQTDRHYFHLYSFIDRLGQHYDVRLLIEQCEGDPEFEHIDSISVRPSTVSRRRWLLGSLTRAWRDGFRLFYCHYTFGAAVYASMLTRSFGGSTWFWHCIMMDVLLQEHNISLRSPGMLMFRAGCRVIQHIVTGSEFMRRHYHRTFGVPLESIEVLPNYIAQERFLSMEHDQTDCRRSLDLPLGVPVVLFVHGLEKGKGGRCIVPIARHILKTHPTVLFLIVGDGTERGIIEAEITEAGFGKNVTLVGSVPNVDIHRYYRAADVFIMPSLYEEFSRTLLEAMAAGVPFVASDGMGGTYDYTSPMQHQMIVPSGDIDAFAGKLAGLLDDENLRRDLIEEGLRQVRHYTEDAVLTLFRTKISNRR